MKTEWRIFGVVALFLFPVAGLYYWWTGVEMPDGSDPIGTTALILSGMLCLMCALYFWFVSRRIDPRPEDRLDGEISDGAGEVGFFSPGSYWPFGLAVAILITGIGAVYFMWWLIVAGAVAILLGTGGLIFEYYTGAHKTE